MQKVILFYKFMPVPDPEAIRLWQRALCEQHGLVGRILIAEHGINGTVSGPIKALKAYAKQTKSYFKDIEFKWSDGVGQEFPKLVVKVRPEIVTFNAASEIEVNDKGIIGGGEHLNPTQVHELVKERGKDVIFFDGRNAYEAEIGKFKDAVVPSVNLTKSFKEELASPKYDAIKNKPVITYCTGGIRCEVLSMLMKKQGFSEVYQIDGGIVNYGKQYKDDGFWEGSLYIFDGRMGMKFSDKAKDIGVCVHCASKTSNYENCSLHACNKLIVICELCRDLKKLTCPVGTADHERLFAVSK